MNVMTLQGRLQRAGYLPIAMDGVFGPQTLAQCIALVAGKGQAPAGIASPMWREMQKRGIDRPLRVINFLANCGTESKFQLVAENLNYTTFKALHNAWPTRFPNEASAVSYLRNPQQLANAVYGGRMGNTQVGDGYKFRGRVWPQLTGRDAYAAIGTLIGLPLTDDPDLLMNVDNAAKAAAAFWEWKHLSDLADQDQPAAVRRKWNGGDNGLDDVLASVALQKSFWGMNP